MYTSDIKILELIDYFKYKKIIPNAKVFCIKIGMANSTISKIKLGKAHFTPEQIEQVCLVFNVNANWIFAIDSKVFNTPDSIEIKHHSIKKS